MGDCVPTPTATRSATTEVDITTLQTTTLLRESTVITVQTGSFPSTICSGPSGNGCSVIIITYRITSTSTTFVPTATSTVISEVTNIIPQKTLFVPCTIAHGGPPSNAVGTLTSVHFPSGNTQDNNSGSPNTNRTAIIGGVVAVVVTLSLSLIGFFMWSLRKKNRAMKATLEEHERREDEINMAQFLPTPYLFTSPPPGPSATDTASSYTPRYAPRNPLSYDHSSTHTRQQFVPGLSAPSMYSMSQSMDRESDSATNDIFAHIRPHSAHSSTAGSPVRIPGLSGINTGGQPSDHRRVSAGAEAKAREARMDRTAAGGRLHAVNITEGVEVDPEHPPSVLLAPPPAYSREGQ